MMNLNILFRLNRLERWFKELYCEFRNSNPSPNPGDGGDGAFVVTTSDQNYTLPSEVTTTIMTFTGSESTLNLPSVSQTKGLIIIVTNAGSGYLTITSPDGVWEGGMNMQSTRMDIGSTARIVNDGITYRINS